MVNQVLKTLKKSDGYHSGKIHFIGIGGIGMSALAKILLETGYQVSGSDLNKNSLTEYFEKQGVAIYTGHSAENIKDCSLVVKSSARSTPNAFNFFLSISTARVG